MCPPPPLPQGLLEIFLMNALRSVPVYSVPKQCHDKVAICSQCLIMMQLD